MPSPVEQTLPGGHSRRYYVYILLCADKTLYTGYTSDLTHRLGAHNRGKGAKYTRSRLPVTLLYWESLPTRSEALRREAAIKRLTRAQKLSLIETGPSIKEEKNVSVLFIEYPKCSTCQKAKRWLTDNAIPFSDRHIVEQNPTADELREWVSRSGLPLKKFFNTSGNKYKELGLKDRLPQMSEEEQLELLATDGMLVKRPLIIGEKQILVGFKPAEWEILKQEAAQ